jgi:hypothetical protein
MIPLFPSAIELKYCDLITKVGIYCFRCCKIDMPRSREKCRMSLLSAILPKYNYIIDCCTRQVVHPPFLFAILPKHNKVIYIIFLVEHHNTRVASRTPSATALKLVATASLSSALSIVRIGASFPVRSVTYVL